MLTRFALDNRMLMVATVIICLLAGQVSCRGWKAPLGGLCSALIFFEEEANADVVW